MQSMRRLGHGAHAAKSLFLSQLARLMNNGKNGYNLNREGSHAARWLPPAK
jgi:hypothetical protein